MAEATTPSTNGINMVNVLAMSGRPDIAAKLQASQYQQMMAQQLMAEGNKEEDINKLANPGGLIVPYSPWQGAAKAAEGVGGQYMLQKSLADQLEAYKGMGGTQANPQAAALGGALSGGGQNSAMMSDPSFLQNLAVAGPEAATKVWIAQNGATDLQKNATNPITAPYVAKDKFMSGPGGALINVSGGSVGQPTSAQPAPAPTAGGDFSTLPVPTGTPSPMKPNDAGKMEYTFGGDDSTPSKPQVETNVTPNPIVGTTPGYNPNDPAALKGAESGTAYQDKLVDESSHALEGKRIMGQMKENLKGFEPGKLADAKSNLAAWGQQIGFDKNDLESRLGNVGDVQSFKKLTAQLAIQAIKQISPKATQMEFQRFLENNPNPDLNPDAMNTLIDYTGKTFDLPLKKQQEWTKWKKQGNSIADYSNFDSDWNKNVGDNLPSTISLKMEKPIIESGGSSGLSPVEQQELQSLRAKYKNGGR